MFYTQYFMNQHLSFHPEIEVAATDQIRLMVRYNLGIGFCPDDPGSRLHCKGRGVPDPSSGRNPQTPDLSGDG